MTFCSDKCFRRRLDMSLSMIDYCALTKSVWHGRLLTTVPINLHPWAMYVSIVLTVIVLCTMTNAFVIPTTTTTMIQSQYSLVTMHGYVPDGLTAEQWKKIQAKEAEKKANLGKVGPRGFKSRSFQSFQEALERGEAAHMMPVENAKERLRKKEIKMEDIPYMQRGGSWDNSDVRGAKKVKWLKSDKSYSDGGFTKEQSVSIFGQGAGLDWTGKRDVGSPGQNPRAIPKPKGYKAPNFKNLRTEDAEPPKKKLFGMF